MKKLISFLLRSIIYFRLCKLAEISSRSFKEDIEKFCAELKKGRQMQSV